MQKQMWMHVCVRVYMCIDDTNTTDQACETVMFMCDYIHAKDSRFPTGNMRRTRSAEGEMNMTARPGDGLPYSMAAGNKDNATISTVASNGHGVFSVAVHAHSI